MTDREAFIIQTAKDYTLEVWEVEDVYRKHGLKGLYIKLEEIIKERQNKP